MIKLSHSNPTFINNLGIISNKISNANNKKTSDLKNIEINNHYKKDIRNEIPMSSLSIKKSNIPTVSKVFHLSKRTGDEDINENFTAHFFTNSSKRFDKNFESDVRDCIVNEYLNENPNAFDKAKFLISKYLTKKILEYQNLEKNKDKAEIRVVQKKIDDERKRTKENKIQTEDVRRLYHAMRKTIEHILDQGGEKKFERLEQKLQEKENITYDLFENKQPKNIETKLDMMGKLRLLVSKKTDEVQIFKEIESNLKLDSTSELVKEFREFGESGLDISIASSRVSSKISKFTEEIKRQKEREEEKKIVKYFDLQNLREKYHEHDKSKIQQIIRRAMVRDTLREHERIRIIGGSRLDKKKEEKIEELKQQTGISMFAVSRKEIKDAKTQIKLDSPLKSTKSHVSMKKLSSKPEKTKSVAFKDDLGLQSHSISRSRVRSADRNDHGKQWGSQSNKAHGKDLHTKFKFFELNEDVPKAEIFKRTIGYANLFHKKSEKNYHKLIYTDNNEINFA